VLRPDGIENTDQIREEIFSRKKAQKAQEPTRGFLAFFAPLALFCGYLA